MSRKKGQTYTAEQKTKIVLEMLKEEMTTGQIAAKYKITSQSLGKWKTQFLENASLAFDVDRSDFYFANPYHSWERGLNEHTNGLIRQYLPKKSVFIGVSKEEILMIQNRLNHRPRKALGYKTPYEVFFSEMSKKLAS